MDLQEKCFYQGYDGKLFGFEMTSKTNQEMYAFTVTSFIFWFTVCVNRKMRIYMNFTKTRKIIAAGLSALMMMCSATPVFATESSGDDLSWLEPGYNGPSGFIGASGGSSGDKSANLNYQVSSSYDWIIHSSIDFGADAGANKTVDRTGNQVKVLKNVIPEGKYLNISVKGSGTNDAFTVDNGGSEVLNYDVSDDNGAVGVNGNVLSVPAGTNTATQNMNFKLNTTKKSAEVAGQYNGRVIYNASVGEQYKIPLSKRKLSSPLVDGRDFSREIPDSATSVIFTDEIAPKGVSITDLTYFRNGDVVGWLDGTGWKVSTQDVYKKINFSDDCSGMFYNKGKINSIQFDNIDTSNVEDMSIMFSSHEHLTSLDLSNFNTSNVTDMMGMFYFCSNLSSIDLHNWYIASGTDVSCMFGWSHITPDSISYLDTSRVNKELMFDH